MIRGFPLRRPGAWMLRLGATLVAVLVLLANGSEIRGQDATAAGKDHASSSQAAAAKNATVTAPRQKKEPENPDLAKTRSEAAELSALADQLRDELNKMTVDVFSLDVLQKTEQAEKLAKKIKGEAAAHLSADSERHQPNP